MLNGLTGVESKFLSNLKTLQQELKPFILLPVAQKRVCIRDVNREAAYLLWLGKVLNGCLHRTIEKRQNVVFYDINNLPYTFRPTEAIDVLNRLLKVTVGDKKYTEEIDTYLHGINGELVDTFFSAFSS